MKYSPLFIGATLLSSSLFVACGSNEDRGDGDSGSSGSGDSTTSDSDTGSTDSASGDSGSTASGSGDGDASTGSSGDGTTSTTGTSGTPDKGNSACGLASGDGEFFGTADINDVEGLDECGGETREVETAAADIFILIDKSSSMGENHVSEDDPDSPTRWEALTESLKAFFQAADSQKLRVGIQYFGLPATDNSSSSDQGLSCDPEEYADPDVDIGRISDISGDLIDSIDSHFPDTFTPTHPALEGALMYTKQWAIDHPERASVLVLATDGYPTVCDDTSINGLEVLVEEYANPTDDSPAVQTFVLGVGEVVNLERVAVKGGTGQAFFVADCPTATDDLLAALKRVANSPASCEFILPEPTAGGQVVDCSKVNVIYQQNGSDVTQSVPHVKDAGSCAAGGWYYEESDGSDCTPGETKIRICPSSCRGLGGGSVRLVVGCDQIELN